MSPNTMIVIIVIVTIFAAMMMRIHTILNTSESAVCVALHNLENCAIGQRDNAVI